MLDRTGLVSFLENTNSAPAADMAKDAVKVHAFAAMNDNEELKITHWNIETADDIVALAKSHPGSWIRLLFFYEGGETSAEDIFIETNSTQVYPESWLVAAEATQLWSLGESTIRSAIRRGQFEKDECKKEGRDWFVKVSAMERLYGEVKAMTVKQAWGILEKEAVSGAPEYWAKVKNGRIIVQRNYEEARKHVAQLGGAQELAPSPGLEDTEWLGFNRDPESIIADSYYEER